MLIVEKISLIIPLPPHIYICAGYEPFKTFFRILIVSG